MLQFGRLRLPADPSAARTQQRRRIEMLKPKARTFAQLLIACVLASALAAVSPGTAPAPDKMKPEEVVAKHLESIGTAEARAKAKSHVIIGQAVATFRIGGTGTAEGGSVLAS